MLRKTRSNIANPRRTSNRRRISNSIGSRPLRSKKRPIKPTSIHLPMVRLSVEFFSKSILTNPAKHLRLVSKNRLKPFDKWNSELLSYDIARVKLGNNTHYVLAVSEMISANAAAVLTKPKRSFIVLDENNNLIGLTEKKHTTLPSQFMDDASYENLADSTYHWAIGERIPAPRGILVKGIGAHNMPYPINKRKSDTKKK